MADRDVLDVGAVVPGARPEGVRRGGVRRGRLLTARPGLPARLARRAPLSLSLVALLWLVAAGTGSVLHGPRHLRSALLLDGARSLHHPAAIVLSMLWAPDVTAYVAGTAVLLTLGVLAESRLGTARYAVALVGTHTAAAATVVGAAWVVGQTHPGWSRAFLTVQLGTPAAGVVGAVLAASAVLPTLWRRRVRVGAVTLVVAMVLFYGGGLAVLLLAATGYGLVLGRTFRAARVTASPVGSVHEARVLAAVIVAATGVGPLLAMLTPVPTGPFATLGYLVADVRARRPHALAELCARAPASVECAMARLGVHPGIGETLKACLPALGLVLVAAGLRRGRRSAWVGALVLEGALAGAVVADFALMMTDATPVLPIPGLSDEKPLLLVSQLLLPCLVPAAIVVLVLVLGRGLFTVRAPAATASVVARRLLLALGFLATLYVGVGLSVPDQWDAPPTLWSLLTDVPLRLVPGAMTFPQAADSVPTGPVATALFDWVGVVFWACAAAVLLHSFRSDATATPQERSRARTILVSQGGHSLAWMGLWEGNRYWFSRSGASYVPYRLVKGVALTVGDPVGPVQERLDVVRAFAQHCESAGVVPCFYSASADLAAACAPDGWGSVQIAEETILRLGAIAFRGRRFQDVRTTLNAAERAGVRVEWVTYRTAPLSTAMQIRAISEEWVSQQSLPEMGFTLGGLAQLDDPDVRCSVAVDDDGVVHAVASWLPIIDAGEVVGWTLDFMRRRSDGFRHATELLIARGALDLQGEGYRVLSLSGAPLARVGGGAHDDPAARDMLDRLLDRLGTRLEPVYGFRSLLRFKAKFDPEYRPLSMLYPDAASLPAIGRAVARAYIPDVSLGTLLRVANAMVSGRPPGRRGPSPESRPTRPEPILPAEEGTHEMSRR
ncbi:MAG TPA: DUF2156 domain-containing protein [Actinotalea sp.]